MSDIFHLYINKFFNDSLQTILIMTAVVYQGIRKVGLDIRIL